MKDEAINDQRQAELYEAIRAQDGGKIKSLVANGALVDGKALELLKAMGYQEFFVLGIAEAAINLEAKSVVAFLRENFGEEKTTDLCLRHSIWSEVPDHVLLAGKHWEGLLERRHYQEVIDMGKPHCVLSHYRTLNRGDVGADLLTVMIANDLGRYIEEDDLLRVLLYPDEISDASALRTIKEELVRRKVWERLFKYRFYDLIDWQDWLDRGEDKRQIFKNARKVGAWKFLADNGQRRCVFFRGHWCIWLKSFG